MEASPGMESFSVTWFLLISKHDYFVKRQPLFQTNYKMKNIYLLFFTLFFIPVLFSGCLRKFDNYGVVDTVISNPSHTTVTVVIAENNAMSYQKNGGFVKTTYSTTYWLKQFETSTGKLIQKKKVFTPSEANKTSISCYGRYGNNIWMHINGLIAFDINSLEEVTNEKAIAAANELSKTIFPIDDRLVTPNIEKGWIDFIADNGVAYRLALTNFKINKKQDEEESEEAEKRISRLFHEDDYGVRCDTLNNIMYSFAKNEVAAKASSPGNGDISETAYRMKLFKATYSIRKLGMHNSFSIDTVQQAMDATYLNPCFALDTYNGNVIHLTHPAGYMVIHQDVLGEKSKAIITRIDTSGKVVWEKPIGVSTKIDGCTLQGKYLLLSTNKDYMFSPFIGKDALCIINIETGEAITPSLSE